MASSSKQAEVIDSLEGGQGHCITPLSSCPHLSEVKPLPKPIDVKLPCSKCQDEKENWICLSCYEVNCGRHLKGDALKHNTDKEHPLALSFSDLSVWCYPCEAYVHNDVFTEIKASAHASKFPA